MESCILLTYLYLNNPMMNFITVISWVTLIPVGIYCYRFVKDHNKKLASEKKAQVRNYTKVFYSENQEA